MKIEIYEINEEGKADDKAFASFASAYVPNNGDYVQVLDKTINLTKPVRTYKNYLVNGKLYNYDLNTVYLYVVSQEQLIKQQETEATKASE